MLNTYMTRKFKKASEGGTTTTLTILPYWAKYSLFLRICRKKNRYRSVLQIKLIFLEILISNLSLRTLKAFISSLNLNISRRHSEINIYHENRVMLHK